jgi:hypothetical protein
MKLYDVFYRDGTMDSSIPLPKKAANNCVAICLNSQSELLTSGPRGKWVVCTREYIDSWFIKR